MKTKRLLKLADFLRNVVAKEKGSFDISKWGRRGDKKLGECGTVCCAFGHAPRVWPRLLKLVSNGVGAIQPMIVVSLKKRSPYKALRRLEGYNLIADFFGIDVLDADRIFSQIGYSCHRRVTPKMVARKIEQEVRRYERHRLKKSSRIHNN